MKDFLAVVAMSVLLCLMVTAGFAVPLIAFVLTYGCGSDEDMVARGLARHPVLAAHPPGADRDGEPSEYCEDDDEIVDVSQGYLLPGADERVIGFYRDTAARAGWRPGTEGPGWICLTRVIADRDVALSVVLSEPPGTYQVSLSASVNNGGGCYGEITPW